jgi:hypothetical protein
VPLSMVLVDWSLSIDAAGEPCRFRHMHWLPRHTRRAVGRFAVVLSALWLLGCERKAPETARKDTAITVAPPPDSVVVAKPEASAWDTTAGTALFVAGPTPQEALVIAPRYTTEASLDSVVLDSARLRSIRVDLFKGGQRVGAAVVGSITGSGRTDSCRTWPSAHLRPAPGDTSTGSWTLAFESGHATPVAVDSIEALSTADSARLAADVARLASALPGDTSAIFRGLPFVVTKAWRAHMPTGQTLLTAVVVRNVNQEANPRQERILLIAERDSMPSARYTALYSERMVGLEETIETTDPIGILLLGPERRPTVIISRDSGNGVSYALIERVGGQWQRRWTSTYAGC